MGQVVVDEMLIKLKLDTQSAYKELNSIRQAIAKTKVSGSSGGDYMAKLKEEEQYYKTYIASLKAQREELKLQKEQEKSTQKTNNKQSKNVKDMAKAFKGAFSSILKLIGGLAIVKSVIQGVSQIISKGRENLYQYARINDNSLGKALDKRDSMIAAFGNAFATFEATVTQVLAPVIEEIFTKLAEFMNRMSKFLAEFLNLPTYFQANTDILEQWKKNNAETRKVVKMLIGGFDSLNIYSGNNVQDYFSEEKNENYDPDKSTWESIKENFTKLIDEILDYASGAIDGAIDWAKGAITSALDFIDPSGTLSEIFNDIGSIVDDLIRAIFGDELADALKDFDLAGIFKGLQTFFSDLGLDIVFDALKNALGEVTTIIHDITSSEWFKAGMDVLKSIIKLLAGKASFIINAITDFTKLLRGEISIEEFVKKTTKSIITNILQPLKEFLASAAKAILTIGDKIFTSLYNMVARLVPGMKTIEHLPAMEDALNQIDAWKSKSVVEDIANVLKIPKSTGSLGSGTRNVGSIMGNYVTATASASGNVFSAPALSWVGEKSTRSNPEIITPQNLLDERLLYNNKHLLSAINSMTNNIVNAVNDISMDVKIDDMSVARAAGRGNRSYYLMTSKSLLV